MPGERWLTAVGAVGAPMPTASADASYVAGPSGAWEPNPTTAGNPPPAYPTAADWTAAYLRAREREGRLYSDPAVAVLPNVPASDPLRSEWLQRSDSTGRLVAALGRLPRPIEVLEIGCGNGWLSNRLAQIPGASVVGLEANAGELDQARRVFAGRSNLRFVHADVRTAARPQPAPDVIVLASVIQYVDDLPTLIRQLLGWLAPGGEIDLLDSPLYRTADVPAARERSRRYYASIGVPEMAASYHHHDWHELDGFAADQRYRPDSVRANVERRVLGRPRSAFPWLVIRNEAAR